MKKGFTLVELLAVIVILSAIVIIAFPAYINVSNNIKNSNLKSIKRLVANSMLNYADKNYIDEIKPANNTCSSGNCCKYYSINYIRSNQIFHTTNGKITNPVTNEELSGYILIRFDTNEYQLTAEYQENRSDTNCEVIG